MRRIVTVALIAVLMSLIVITDGKLRAHPRADPLGRRLLYLPSIEAVKLLSLGNRGFAADLLYLWSIQYYSVFSADEKYLYLETMFDLITDLDPLYFDAYAIGGLILGVAAAQEPSRMASVITLYDKGIAAMPDDASLAELAAWDFYILFKDTETAVIYAEQAALRPNAPSRLKRLIGRWRDKDHLWTADESIAYWQEAISEAADKQDRNNCRSHLYDVIADRDRQSLDPMLQTYQAVHGRCPESWQALVLQGILREVPVDYMGNPYDINQVTCTLQPWKRIRGD